MNWNYNLGTGAGIAGGFCGSDIQIFEGDKVHEMISLYLMR